MKTDKKLLFIFFLLFTGTTAAEQIEGKVVKVLDGDTVQVLDSAKNNYRVTEPNDFSRWLMWPQPRSMSPTFHFPEEKYPSHSDADGYSQWLSTNEKSECYAIVKNFTFSHLSEPTFDIEVKNGGLSHDYQLVKSMGSLLLLDYVGEAVHPESNGYPILLKACVTAAKRYWQDSYLQNGSNIG